MQGKFCLFPRMIKINNLDIGNPMDQEEHEKMWKAKQERDRLQRKLCGVVTIADMDPFIREGMTRQEARRAAMKFKLKKHK